nr:hypothetical protein [Tanacetum cinerariifolium]
MNLENDNEKVNMPWFPSPEPSVSCIDDLDFFKDFENEFPAILYNDALTSKSDFLTEPTLCPQHIDEFNLKAETSLSEYKNNDNDKIDIEQPSGVEGMARHKELYIISSHTKKIFANMRRIGASFYGVITPLFDFMMVQAAADMGDIPVKTYQTPIVDQPSTFKLQKPQKPMRKQRKEADTSHGESADEDHVPTPSSDPLPSEDAQTKEITVLKKKVTKLTKWKKLRSRGLRRLKRVGSGRRVKSLMKKDSFGAKEDASKDRRMIKEIDQNADIALDDETQGRINDDEIVAPTTYVTEDEIIMAQALAALKSVKPKDNMQAMMDANGLLAERLQAREKEELSDVQKARLLVELIEKRKKHFAALRAQEKRSKPPTKTQMKSQISTYLRHMGGYKQSHLKGRSFDEIKELFNREIRKKQKVDENVEPAIDDFEELRKCIEIVSDNREEVLIEATPISSRSPTIIDYKIHKEGKKNYFKIIRVDGNSQVYQTFERMFKNFNREDLEVLWAIIKNRFKKEKPVDDMDNILFRTLKIMFEHHVEDTI